MINTKYICKLRTNHKLIKYELYIIYIYIYIYILHITPIHKKGDKLNAENYRAIALLSIPGKVFCKILMCRYSNIIEESISDSQFGFMPGRGTIDAIFIVRQIIEKAREHQVPLHIHFIDFKAAFDTIWREALWKMMIQIGIPQKYVTIIKNLYNDTNCAIIAGGQLTD